MAEQLKTVAPIATSVGGALLGASLFGPGGAFVGTAGGGIGSADRDWETFVL